MCELIECGSCAISVSKAPEGGYLGSANNRGHTVRAPRLHELHTVIKTNAQCFARFSRDRLGCAIGDFHADDAVMVTDAASCVCVA